MRSRACTAPPPARMCLAVHPSPFLSRATPPETTQASLLKADAAEQHDNSGDRGGASSSSSYSVSISHVTEGAGQGGPLSLPPIQVGAPICSPRCNLVGVGLLGWERFFFFFFSHAARRGVRFSQGGPGPVSTVSSRGACFLDALD